MTTPAEKTRQARRIAIEIEGMTFHGFRPSVEEYFRVWNDDAKVAEVAKRYIDGWAGVRERDLFEDGSEDLIEFSPDNFSELIADRVDIGAKIVQKLAEATNKKIEKMHILGKNSPAGSSTSKSKNTRTPQIQ